MFDLKTLEKTAAVVALAVALAAAYYTGKHGAEEDALTAQVKAVAQQRNDDVAEMQRRLDQTTANARMAQAIAVATAVAQAKLDSAHTDNTKAITTYVQAHPSTDVCTLDDDGLRLWRAANAGVAP
jgi:ribosomal 50S subunit-associated protein YjgA (DUF615 family)